MVAKGQLRRRQGAGVNGRGAQGGHLSRKTRRGLRVREAAVAGASVVGPVFGVLVAVLRIPQK